MHILALDIATSTGWARWRESNNSLTYDKQTFTSEPGGFAAEFTDWLNRMLAFPGNPVTNIVIETVVPQTTGMTSLDVLLRAHWANVHIRQLAKRRDIAVTMVTVGQWRSHFIGRTTAPKELTKSQRRSWLKKATIQKCIDRGWLVKSDDIADALGILDYGRCILNPTYGAKTAPLFMGAANG